MQVVLEKINALPNVVGSMVCNDEGRLLASLFPPVFDSQDIVKASGALSDCALGLHDALGGIKNFDFRYGDSRILVRAFPKAFLLMLCAKTVNLQLLSISLNVVYKKLEKLVEAAESIPVSQPLSQPAAVVQPISPPLPQQSPAILTTANGLISLQSDLLKTTANTYWEQMLASVAVNKMTAKHLSDHYKHGAFKKLRLTCPESGVSKIFSVNIITDDPNRLYDGKIVINKAVLETLKTEAGKYIHVELAVGTGYLGWEGI